MIPIRTIKKMNTFSSETTLASLKELDLPNERYNGRESQNRNSQQMSPITLPDDQNHWCKQPQLPGCSDLQQEKIKKNLFEEDQKKFENLKVEILKFSQNPLKFWKMKLSKLRLKEAQVWRTEPQILGQEFLIFGTGHYSFHHLITGEPRLTNPYPKGFNFDEYKKMILSKNHNFLFCTFPDQSSTIKPKINRINLHNSSLDELCLTEDEKIFFSQKFLYKISQENKKKLELHFVKRINLNKNSELDDGLRNHLIFQSIYPIKTLRDEFEQPSLNNLLIPKINIFGKFAVISQNIQKGKHLLTGFNIFDLTNKKLLIGMRSQQVKRGNMDLLEFENFEMKISNEFLILSKPFGNKMTLLIDLAKRKIKRTGEYLSPGGFLLDEQEGTVRARINPDHLYFENKTKSTRILPPCLGKLIQKIEAKKVIGTKYVKNLEGRDELVGLIEVEGANLLYNYSRDEVVAYGARATNAANNYPINKDQPDYQIFKNDNFYSVWMREITSMNKDTIGVKFTLKKFKLLSNQLSKTRSIRIEFHETWQKGLRFERTYQGENGSLLFEFVKRIDEERQDYVYALFQIEKQEWKWLNIRFNKGEKIVKFIQLHGKADSFVITNKNRLGLCRNAKTEKIEIQLRKADSNISEGSGFLLVVRGNHTKLYFAIKREQKIFQLTILKKGIIQKEIYIEGIKEELSKSQHFCQSICKEVVYILIGETYYTFNSHKFSSGIQAKYKVKGSAEQFDYVKRHNDLPRHFNIRSRVESEGVIIFDTFYKGEIKKEIFPLSINSSNTLQRNCHIYKGKLYRMNSCSQIINLFSNTSHFQSTSLSLDPVCEEMEILGTRILEVIDHPSYSNYLIFEKVMNLSTLLVIMGEPKILKKYLENFSQYFIHRSEKKWKNLVKFLFSTISLNLSQDCLKSLQEALSCDDHELCQKEDDDWRTSFEELTSTEGDIVRFRTRAQFNQFLKEVKRIKNQRKKRVKNKGI